MSTVGHSAARQRLLAALYLNRSGLNETEVADAIVAVAQAVRDTPPPPVTCVYECRPYPTPIYAHPFADPNAPMGAWCKTHGWDCPGNSPTS
jgi:hypothetical protein